MTAYRLDSRFLYRLLDARRVELGLSWRAVARELAVEPVVLRRLAVGGAPDAHGLLSVVLWLGWAPELQLLASGVES